MIAMHPVAEQAFLEFCRLEREARERAVAAIQSRNRGEAFKTLERENMKEAA